MYGLQLSQSLPSNHLHLNWRVPNPPGANPLVAERAFPTSDYWGRRRVARCVEEMTGICRDFQWLLTPCHTRLQRPARGPFSYQGLATGGLGTRQLNACDPDCWGKLNRGVSKPGDFPLFSGKVQIVSRTLSGLFLVGALNRPRKRKGTNREDPQTIPEQIRKIPENRESPKKDKKGRTSPEQENPPFEPPPPFY